SPPPRVLHTLVLAPLSSPLFPYTTLFRSPRVGRGPRQATAHDALRSASVSSHQPTHACSTWIPSLRIWCCSACRVSDGSTSAKRSEEHTSELQSRFDLVCRLLLEKKKDDD